MTGTILRFLGRMLSAMAAALPAVAVLRLLGMRRLRRRGLTTTPWHEAGLWAFLLFLAGLAALTVIPRSWQWIGLSWDRVNLSPFRVFRESAVLWQRSGSPEYFVINVLGNILIFLPLGFFPCLLWEDRGRGLLRGTGWALLASLCVELCQLPQDRGTDIDDLWLNALGGALGCGLYRLVKRLRPGAVEKFRVKSSTAAEKESRR